VRTWLPEALYPVAMRLARADAAAEELSRLALAWSRGPRDAGAITLRQVERTPGTYDVEIASIRPIPPLAAMLFSEAVHHLRSAVDNTVFYVAEKESGEPFTREQARIISMLVYDQPEKYRRAIQRLATGKNAIPAFGSDSTLGRRMASLQPFNDDAVLPSMSPLLASMMGVEVVNVHPLGLLRDYSNEDKHRAIRVGAAGVRVQTLDDSWRESISRGMRHVEVGTVVEQVTKGVLTGVEISPALQVQRPDGKTWVAYGPELDGMARHVANIVIPILVTGMALPDAIPAHIELNDNGRTLAERLHHGGNVRAHERVRGVMAAALAEANEQAWKVAPVSVEDASSGLE
jgi:hypothetical protein